MSRLLVALAVAGALTAGACARGETLGVDEAIEVLVIDGVDRDRATCIVEQLDGQLDLEKVTGLDIDLTNEDLLMLGTATAGCAPPLAPGGGVVGGDDGLDDPPGVDVQVEVAERVAELIEGGIAPPIGACLLDRILLTEDPQSVVIDDIQLSSLVVDCQRLLEG